MTAVGEPALADEFTGRHFRVSLAAARTLMVVLLLAVVYAAVAVLLLLDVMPDFASTFILTTAPVLLIIGVFPWKVHSLLVPSAWAVWRAAPARLLAEQPWRETPATLLNTTRTVLALPGGERVRVHWLPRAVREVVARSGRVWIVGPDAKGWLAVRVDGLYASWPAQVVRGRRGSPAISTGEPIATIWVRYLAGQMRASFVLGVVGTVMMSLGLLVPDSAWLSLLYLIGFLVVVVVCGLRFLQATRLRHTGPWVRAEAAEQTFHDRGNGLADGTVVLSFPDGRTRTAHLDRAPLDLFANVRNEKALWVADNGVVGFPYYPVVAVAKLV